MSKRRTSYDRWQPWPETLSVGARRVQAARRAAELTKKGKRTLSPVVAEAREITATFWGDAWCKNLEGYSDFANRLPRGRSYLRNGSVLDLQIEPGRVTALVSGTETLRGRGHRDRRAAGPMAGDLSRFSRRDRFSRRTAAGQAVDQRDGAPVPPGHRAVPDAARDPHVVQLPG